MSGKKLFVFFFAAGITVLGFQNCGGGVQFSPSRLASNLETSNGGGTLVVPPGPVPPNPHPSPTPSPTPTPTPPPNGGGITCYANLLSATFGSNYICPNQFSCTDGTIRTGSASYAYFSIYLINYFYSDSACTQLLGQAPVIPYDSGTATVVYSPSGVVPVNSSFSGNAECTPLNDGTGRYVGHGSYTGWDSGTCYL